MDQGILHIHTFVVLDLDRTLLHTDQLNMALCQLVDKTEDATPENGDPYKYITSTEGKSLSVRGYLADRYGEQSAMAAHQQLLDGIDSGALGGFVFPGVLELFDKLERNTNHFGVLTYGEETNQHYKLEVLQHMRGPSAQAVPAEVTDIHNKAGWIEQEWTRDGADGDYFEIPVELTNGKLVHARHVMVLDDKRQNIEATNTHIVGYLVQNEKTPTEDGHTIQDFLKLVTDGELERYVEAHAG